MAGGGALAVTVVRVLGLLFGQPDRRFQSAELIRLAKGGVGAVHRQLGRLAETDLVTVTLSGNQKHYQARRDSPVFEELRSLIVKTVGVAEPLRQALPPIACSYGTRHIRAFASSKCTRVVRSTQCGSDSPTVPSECATRTRSSGSGLARMPTTISC